MKLMQSSGKPKKHKYMSDKPITRRSVIASVGALSVTGFLAACATESEPTAVAPADTPTPSQSDDQPITTDETSIGLIAVTEIPVGGAIILSEEKLVLTQPIAGEVGAFSVTCTHQGCPVSQVSGDGIVCACHNSVFSTLDGSVISGPATRGLDLIEIKVENGQVFKA
jgi:Rieske Fe-S protein